MSHHYDEGPSVWCSQLHPILSYRPLSLLASWCFSFFYLRVSFLFFFIHLSLFLPVKLKGSWAGICSSVVLFTHFLLFFFHLALKSDESDSVKFSILWNVLVIKSIFFILALLHLFSLVALFTAYSPNPLSFSEVWTSLKVANLQSFGGEPCIPTRL